MKKMFLVLLCSLSFLGAAAQQTFTHPWQGARVAFLGDSITDPGSVPDKHDWTGRKDSHYWGFLQEWLGIRPFVYGVSGCSWSDVPGQASLLQQEHGEAFDAITIFMGTNDFEANVPLGEWYERQLKTTTAAMGYPETEYLRMARTPAMDPGTFRGRINIAVNLLKRLYPDKQIVLLTPIHRAFATFGPQNIQPDESFPNTAGRYFLEYVEAIKEAGDVWGVPVIDLCSLCGINPMVEEQVLYFSDSRTDRLHPNAKGHERLARTLLYQLLALPCRF